MSKMNKILTVLAGIQLVLFAVMLFVDRGSAASSDATPRALVPGSITDVVRIRIEDGDDEESIEFARTQDGWVVASADDFPVEAGKITKPSDGDNAATATPGVLDKIFDLRVARPVLRKRSNHEAVKVADEKFERRVTLLDDDGKELAVVYVATGARPRTVYVRRAGEDEVYQVEGLATWDLSVSQTTWVDSKYIELSEDDVTKLELTLPEKQLTLAFERREVPASDPTSTKENEKKNGEESDDATESGDDAAKPKAEKTESVWWMTRPENRRAKKSEVDSLVRRFSTLRFSRVLGKSAPDDAGLDEPQATCIAQTKDGKTVTLLIGNMREKDGIKRYVAKADSSDYYVLISSWDADTFLKADASKFLEEEKTEKKSPAETPNDTKNSKPKEDE